MKKIIYFAAPLMAMSFMVGCNKVTTHKVASVLTVDEKLKFYTMNDKELENTRFNHKKDFKFKVKSINDAAYSIDPYGIGVYIGEDAQMPLIDGIDIKFANDKHTEATVTIAANKVTDDIYIDSIAHKEGNYIYSVPIMIDVEMSKGTKTLGWQEKGKPLTLQFRGTNDKPSPNEYCFLYSPDLEKFYCKGDNSTFMNKVTVTPAADAESYTKVEVAEDAIENDYLLIAARSGEKSSFLERFTWDEIKTFSQDGSAKYLFNLGDTKTIKLKTDNGQEVEHVVKIIGFNHDYTDAEHPDDTKVGLTFQFATAITFEDGGMEFPFLKVWNDGTTPTAANFEEASLNKFLQNQVFSYLPEDLSKNIVTVSKKVGKHTSSWKATSYPTKLFPLAAIEMSTNPRSQGGTSLYCLKDEGTTYSYYIGDDVHEKRVVEDANGTAQTYWLRSPSNSGNKGYANYVLNDGHLSGTAASVNKTALGVVPAFAI